MACINLVTKKYEKNTIIKRPCMYFPSVRVTLECEQSENHLPALLFCSRLLSVDDIQAI